MRPEHLAVHDSTCLTKILRESAHVPDTLRMGRDGRLSQAIASYECPLRSCNFAILEWRHSCWNFEERRHSFHQLARL